MPEQGQERQPRTFRLGKLIRGKLLGKMHAEDQKVNYEILDDDKRYLEALEDKAKEESGELRLTVDVDHAIEELADLQQVIDDAAVALGRTPEDVREAQAKKLEKAGDFAGRIFVHTVYVDPAKSPELYDYYSQNPERFPTQLD